MAQRNSQPRVRRRHWRTLAVLLCALVVPLARAASGVDVEIHGVDDAIRDNVLAYLSFERYKKGGSELTPEVVERLHNRVEREVDSALRPFGYYEPQVESSVTQESANSWKLVLNITPGPPVLVDKMDVQVLGPGASDPLFRRILRRLPLKVGDVLNHKAYEGIKTDLQRTAATYGYLAATLDKNEMLVDPVNHKASITLQLTTGPRYHFGKTTITQDVVRESLVRRYLRYHEGDPFDLTQVLRSQFALDDSQYFTNLEVLPGKADPDTLSVPVTIHASPSRRHRYSVGAGFATDTGPRGTLGFEDHRINDRGHTFSVEVQAAQVTRYSLQSRYTIPIGDPAVENFSLRASAEQRDWGDVTTNTVSAGPALTAVTGSWQHVWAINAVNTKSYLDIDSLMSQTDSLLVPELDIASVPKGYLGEPLFEHPLFIEIKGSHSSLGSNSNWLQVHIQAERVFRLAPKWHLLLRGEVGATAVSEFSQLPTVFRFFGGGDNSVRGFALNDLSPRQQTTICATAVPKGAPCGPIPPGQTDDYVYVKVGGKDVITGTFEIIRDLPKNLGVAAFFDYGNAFDKFTTRLAYSAGIGVRVRLPVLTLGIDIAQPIYEPCQAPFETNNCAPHSPRLHINFSPKL
jgi:translocation and assembly module TamA